MTRHLPDDPPPAHDSGPRSRLPWFLAAGCFLVILLALLVTRNNREPAAPAATLHNSQPNATGSVDTTVRDRLFARLPNPRSHLEPASTAEEIVAAKVAQFARSRRQLARAMAEHFKTPIPDEFERFFDAAEAGRYEEMKAIYKSLRAQREGGADTSW